MRTAIYIEHGLTQVVLTPETEFEKNCLGSIPENAQIKLLNGGFSECRGGWIRGFNEAKTISLMILLKPQETDPGTPQLA